MTSNLTFLIVPRAKPNCPSIEVLFPTHDPLKLELVLS